MQLTSNFDTCMERNLFEVEPSLIVICQIWLKISLIMSLCPNNMITCQRIVWLLDYIYYFVFFLFFSYFDFDMFEIF